MGQLEDLVARFAGPDGERRLLEVLQNTELIRGIDRIATAFAAKALVEGYPIGAAIITQGSADNEFFFVLAGSVVVERNERPGPVRMAGAHFGEMAVVDPRALRSATVRARESCIVARIPEPEFAIIANEFPQIWQRLASELAVRLRQRLADVPQRNEKAVVFIGSSRERLEIATGLRDGLVTRGVDVQIWSSGVFGASDTSIESLEEAVRLSDFGVLLMAPDDEVTSRGETFFAPRDNVVFELGLFMGALGRARTFALNPPGKTKIPSDLFGVTPLRYDDGSKEKLAESLASACNELLLKIAKLGPK